MMKKKQEKRKKKKQEKREKKKQEKEEVSWAFCFTCKYCRPTYTTLMYLLAGPGLVLDGLPDGGLITSNSEF